MKVKYKKASRSGALLYLDGKRSVRPAGEPIKLSVRFGETDARAQDVVILIRTSGSRVAPGLPERLRHCAAIGIGILFLFSAATAARAVDRALAAKHENLKRFYDETHKPVPTLLEIKQAAEKGDVAAQMALADIYNTQLDYPTALSWYRKAADHGNTNAQYIVGNLLLAGRTANASCSKAIIADPNEAVIWLGRAANQGHALAEVALGRCYREGLGVNQDFVEAFKWFALAAKQTNVVAKDAVRELTLKLRTEEVAAAQARADAFMPGADLELPEPSYLGGLKLNGITGSNRNRLAIVNNHTIGLNESTEIKLGSKAVEVKCLEIRTASVLLQVGPYRKELQFRD